MMDTNKSIKQAILATFRLTQGTSNTIINQKIKSFKGLQTLFNMLCDATIQPKFVMEELQIVIINIKLKQKPTVLETQFLLHVNTLVDEPFYEKDKELDIKFTF